ncbi:hypothetical protein [Thermococcus sp.]|uniref:hypothetical protein n=1 Tax=Thermococcus sp. TaxID=35749 RepID=UPI00262684F3|nr:hypothetical protein [Thermococcus sp.]
MRVRLGYPDRIVEVADGRVYLFNGRLLSAPIEEVLNQYTKGEGLLHPELRDVVPDVVRLLLRGGDLGSIAPFPASNVQTASG